MPGVVIVTPYWAGRGKYQVHTLWELGS